MAFDRSSGNDQQFAELDFTAYTINQQSRKIVAREMVQVRGKVKIAYAGKNASVTSSAAPLETKSAAKPSG